MDWNKGAAKANVGSFFLSAATLAIGFVTLYFTLNPDRPTAGNIMPLTWIFICAIVLASALHAVAGLFMFLGRRGQEPVPSLPLDVPNQPATLETTIASAIQPAPAFGMRGVAKVTHAPTVTRDYEFTTSGGGRQEIDVGFPIDHLRLFAPEQVRLVLLSELPKTFKSDTGSVSLSIAGAMVVLNDNGSKIRVEFQACCGGTIEDRIAALTRYKSQ